MKITALLLVAAAILVAQAPVTINPGDPIVSATMNSNFSGLYTGKASRWAGAGPPGSFMYSLQGDIYIDTSNNHLYGCFAVGPCTSVATGNWQRIDLSATGLADPGSNGILSRTSSGTVTPRAITGTTSNISVTNGDGVSGNPTIDLFNTACAPGTYGDATHVPQVTFDAKGRCTAATPVAISGSGGVGDPGGNGIMVRTALNTSVPRSITGTAGELTISNPTGVSGNINVGLTSTAVTPGACGDGTHFPIPTFDAKGRATGCATQSVAAGSIPITTHTLKGDGAGNAAPATGTDTDCVLVNGNATPCGSGATTGTSIKGALSVADSGTANSYVGCDANSTAPVDGLVVILKPLNDNSGASTYNHCSSGSRPIQTSYGAAMLAGSLRADGAASPSGVLLRYSSAANGAAGAWQNLTPSQIQLPPQTTASMGSVPRADGTGLTQWAQPANPGDGRRTSSVVCNGVSGDLTNTALNGAYFTVGSGAGGLSSSASTGSGTQFPTCIATTGASSGNNVYFNLSGDSKIFKTGRNLQFDVTAALGATTSTRNWIGLTGAAASTIAGSATPTTSGFLGFRYDTGAGDTAWQCVVSSASATVVSSSVAPSTNQVHLKFIADDTNNAVHFYIDGTEVCSATSVANYPAAAFLSFALTETTLTTATRAITMAYQWIQSDR